MSSLQNKHQEKFEQQKMRFDRGDTIRQKILHRGQWMLNGQGTFSFFPFFVFLLQFNNTLTPASAAPLSMTINNKFDTTFENINM